MEILSIDGYKKYSRIDCKTAKCLKIRYKDENGDKYHIIGSCDHRIVIDSKYGIGKGKWKRLDELEVGDCVSGVGGGFTIYSIEEMGERKVYTPVDVGGSEYLCLGLRHHNCSFIGSTNTLIDGEWLDKMVSQEPTGYKYGYDLTIYEEPVAGALYVMGVDSAMGNAGDYSAIQVLRVVGRGKYRQAAVYKRNTVKPDDYADIVDAICRWYNNAMYIIENNDIGRSVADRLFYEIGNECMISTDKHGALGTKADRNSKLDACKMLKQAIEKGELEIVDADTIDQLSRFEEVSPNVFRGQAGKHDDLVSSLYWAVYCLAQPEIDLDGLKLAEKVVTDDALPPPMYMDMGGNNPFGTGVDSNSFWAGLH